MGACRRRRPTRRAPGAYSDTGLSEQVAARVEGLHDLVLGVTRSVFGAVRQVARPDEVSVSFGIELAARPGKVVGLLAEAEGKAAINVTLAWKRSPEEDGVRCEPRGLPAARRAHA